MTAALGALLSFAALRRGAHPPRRRRAGSALGWMAFGIVLYVAYRLSEGKPVLKRVTIPERALTRRRAPRREYGSILVPVLGRAARRRHHADRRPPGRRGERGRGRGRRGDRGAVGVRGADGAAARRARARRGPQARPQGARSAPRRWGRSTRASRSPPRPCAPAAPARRSCARPSAAAWRRSCSPPRSRPRMRGGPLLGGKRGLLRHVRGRDHALRGQQGAVPRDPHRAARRRRTRQHHITVRAAAHRRPGRGRLRQRRHLRYGRGGPTAARR